MRNKNPVQIIILIAISLPLISCGTLGHIQFYEFNRSKMEVEADLLHVINRDSLYSPPKSWNEYELGADSVMDIFIYFHSNPEEIYQVGFINPDTWNSSNTSVLALVGAFDGKLWHFEKDLNSRGEKRMMQRFETEILSRMQCKYSKR